MYLYSTCTDSNISYSDDNSTDPLILLGNDMGGVDLEPQPDLHSDKPQPQPQQNYSALLVDLLGDLPSSVDNTSVIVPTDDFGKEKFLVCTYLQLPCMHNSWNISKLSCDIIDSTTCCSLVKPTYIIIISFLN